MPTQEEMYSQPVTSSVRVPRSDSETVTQPDTQDSRMAVADILSSMANGNEVQTTTYSGLEGMHCGVLTRTTPTLTPTTLRTFEQAIGYELQADPTPPHHNQAGFVPPPLNPTGQAGAASFVTVDSKTWQGGCTTVIPRPSTASPPDMVNCITTTTNHNLAQVPRRNTGGRRPNNNEKLSPEEEDRRNQRRERNKLAAARCRKRRMDHTNLLLGETEELESIKQTLTVQLQRLQTEKDELEYLLHVHKPCKRPKNGRSSSELYIKQEPEMDGSCATTTAASLSRPTSLPVSSNFKPPSGEMVGIPLNTPSSCIPNFESLIEGSSLTPVTGHLVSLSGGGTTPGGSVSTPTILIPDSCSNQQRNSSSSSSDLSSPESHPPKLVSL